MFYPLAPAGKASVEHSRNPFLPSTGAAELVQLLMFLKYELPELSLTLHSASRALLEPLEQPERKEEAFKRCSTQVPANDCISQTGVVFLLPLIWFSLIIDEPLGRRSVNQMQRLPFVPEAKGGTEVTPC